MAKLNCVVRGCGQPTNNPDKFVCGRCERRVFVSLLPFVVLAALYIILSSVKTT